MTDGNGGEQRADRRCRVARKACRPVSVATPGSSTGDPIFGSIDIDLAAGQTLEEPITYVVPAQAAAGAYDVYAFAGAYPRFAERGHDVDEHHPARR